MKCSPRLYRTWRRFGATALNDMPINERGRRWKLNQGQTNAPISPVLLDAEPFSVAFQLVSGTHPANYILWSSHWGISLT